MSTSWRVAEAVMDCEGAAWDGCHKVFVLMDKDQVEKMALEYGYGQDETSFLVTAEDSKRSDILAMVKEWYQKSCPLKFVQSIATDPGPEDGVPVDDYVNLVPQGGYWR